MPDTEFDQPVYPKMLMKKDWDKNKGVIAKMHGSTGIGDQMKDCFDAYSKVAWAKLNLFKLRMDWRTVTIKKWEDFVDDAEAEMNGKLADLVDDLQNLRDLAVVKYNEFKKAKTIPKSSENHVADVAQEAHDFAELLTVKTVDPILTAMDQEYRAHLDKNFVSVFPSALKLKVSDHANTVAEFRKAPTVNGFENVICFGMCRDLTTGLGNIAKCHDKGFVVKNGPAAQKLFDKLNAYGNQEIKVKKVEEIEAHLQAVEKLYTAVKKFTDGI